MFSVHVECESELGFGIFSIWYTKLERKKMTGEKNRFKTVEKLWKLDDEQLKTPRHDEMVLNLLTKESLFRQIPQIGKWFNLIEMAYFNDIELKKTEIENYPNLRLNELENYILYNETKEERVVRETEEKQNELKLIKEFTPSIKINSEHPIFSGHNKFLIGYWDVVIDLFKWMGRNERQYIKYASERIGPNFKDLIKSDQIPSNLFIEVKPTITSFGATLRQIRTYQSYCDANETNTILYTNDVQFKEAFESQGIKVVNPPKRQTTL